MSTERAPIKLLLVDDAVFARDFLLAILAEVESGIELTWRSDYATGLESLQGGGFDVCLLDYQLGDRSGLDLLREAKRLGVRLPIIMLTGHGSAELDHEAMRAGAADYLVKGDFSAESLDRIVRYLLERTRAEDARRDSEERYALAMEGSNDGLWDWRVGEKEIHYSSRWKRILGYEPDELPDLLESWWERVHDDDRVRLDHDFDGHLRDTTTPHFENEHRLRHKDGTWRHVLVRGKAVRDERGRATRMAGSLTDVTMARSRDPLTGLANRVLYLDRLEHSFHRAARDATYRFALLFIDLDRFKNINDSLGHDIGDELLVAIARRLEGCVRLVDTVARLGGDEFVVLLDESREPDGATRVANRIIEELARAFVIGSRELFTGASIGIALSSQHYKTPGELLRDADTAMYRAKAEGRGRFVIFDGAMHARAVHVLSVESGLRRALEAHQLEVFYQPVISLGSQRPLGFEALVRWRHPERGLVAPCDFIPVAEDSSLIVLLDLHVLKSAATQLRAWRDEFKVDLSVAVNASRRHFSRAEYSGDVAQAIEVAGLPAKALRLEVTESVTMDLPETARAQLAALHALGVQLYVDDFGVGYSSLSMLHTYPFTGIKLDRSFVAGLDGATSSTEVVRAILAIAQALKLEVVAEGVETLGQHDALISLGCTRGQGFRYARPMAASDAAKWLSSKL
ncbi:MAG: EAL domain-containing protein [Archangium sp.]|nr:EAL domain-containing protein [Archangium sp.]